MKKEKIASIYLSDDTFTWCHMKWRPNLIKSEVEIRGISCIYVLLDTGRLF